MISDLDDAYTSLDNLQKNTSGMQVMERPSAPVSTAKVSASRPVDFNKLVDELHLGVCKIWRKLEDVRIIKKEGGEVASKDPLDILGVSFRPVNNQFLVN